MKLKTDKIQVLCELISPNSFSEKLKLASQSISYASVVTSGLINMVKFEESTNGNNSIGDTVSCALQRAQLENRLVVGVSAVAKGLYDSNDDAIFLLLSQPDADDSATHLHSKLLEAFCYENDIYIIKVDSSKKLSRILKTSNLECCALIQRSNSVDNQSDQLTTAEESMVDHCEEFWDCQHQPIVVLPE